VLLKKEMCAMFAP